MKAASPQFRRARIRSETTITSIAGENELLLANVPSGDLLNADLVITSGPKAGQSVLIMAITGNKVKVLSSSGIVAGTAVRLDNSWLLALQYYQRHQIPTPREYGWDQYLGPDGAPLYPQRKVMIGPMLNASSAGSVADGRFHGKMIMVESVLDVSAYPWSGDWYRKHTEGMSDPQTSDNFRLWYMDNADHGPDLSGYTAGVAFEGVAKAADHIVGYLGEVQQALLDLDAWVTKGTPPPASTGYRMDADNQVQLAPDAEQRYGVQPVVKLTATAKGYKSPSQKVDVKAGRPVTLTARAQTPPMAGRIVNVEWDFEGLGVFTKSKQTIPVGPEICTNERYTFKQPGTYFPVVRVTSQHNGDGSTPYGLIQNLASVRVVVK